MEWMAVFVVKTALGMTPVPNVPPYYFRSYRACADFVADFNKDTPEARVSINAVVQVQRREARCWSVGEQEKPEGEP